MSGPAGKHLKPFGSAGRIADPGDVTPSALATSSVYRRWPVAAAGARPLLGRPRALTLIEDRQRSLGPSNVLLLERNPAHQRQVRADSLSPGKVLLFVAAVQHASPHPFVALQFGGGPLQSFHHEVAHSLRVTDVDGQQFDREFIANHTGLRRPGGELVDRLITRFG